MIYGFLSPILSATPTVSSGAGFLPPTAWSHYYPLQPEKAREDTRVAETHGLSVPPSELAFPLKE